MRGRFVDAAVAILCEAGEQGISARLVAARAGLKTQLLYYYFRTMDDLLLAVVERVNHRRRDSFERAMASPQPLRALWNQQVDPSTAALAAALSGIAARREAVGAVIVASGREFRRLQTDAVARLLAPAVSREEAAGIVMIGASLARMLVIEMAVGLDEGHAPARAIVERFLARHERAASGPKRR